MKSPPRCPTAFTLVELMVSTAIIGLIMIVLVQMTNQTSNTWRSTTEKIEKFQEARDGFEAMTRRLSQATLNTYWDYLDSSGAPRNHNVTSSQFLNFIPYMYGRMSDLRFASGPMSQQFAAAGGSVAVAPLGEPNRIRPGHGIFFQAPFGVVNTSDAQTSSADYGIMNNLLNTWGYFVEADADSTRPNFLDPGVNPSAHVLKRWRSRLMEYRLPSEQMNLFDYGPTTLNAAGLPAYPSFGWFNLFLPMTTANRPVRVIAENVLTLVLLPKLSNADQDQVNTTYSGTYLLSPNYAYDSVLTVNPGPNAYAGTNAGILANVNPKNQLPPIVSVTMIAVDERSAERLFDKYCTRYNADGSGGPNSLGPGLADATMGLSTSVPGYGTAGGPFTNALNLELLNGDLATVELALQSDKINYRVFTTNVTIRGAKWSRSQTK